MVGLHPWVVFTCIGLGTDPDYGVTLDPRRVTRVESDGSMCFVTYLDFDGVRRARVRGTAEDAARAVQVALATAPDASDETRLAAGWVQEFRAHTGMVPCYYDSQGDVTRESSCTPAPLPAGGWRHIGDGRSMRWVLAEVLDVG